ncbi:hypothetical protein DWB85_05700 [Seongchinamella sediminis]|uniref:Uncharacterized protein n=1 Tax=Seongchinamella sediminis TaxID=2283635 RepID=A0A3L7E213_9GAMM|nr:hypothetical protein [Seongchinamella sediminis]RLQ22935.1 hypothetical protein DWB85_05700 [Seongchinamella sediminis]
MSSARGQANHALYLANILLAAWRRDLAEESVAAVTLNQAYLPAIRAHLRHAYGWFLLEITRPGALPPQPPASLAELPGIDAGKALPGEIVEFQRLEAGGWIGDMLADDTAEESVASSGNLARGAPASGPEQASQWAGQLQSLFDRMGDSLDEY